MSTFRSAIDGHKTYLLVAIGMLLTAATQGPEGAEAMDLGAWVSDPEFMESQLGLLLVASFRSALGKIGGG